jgi:hypothetical protein
VRRGYLARLDREAIIEKGIDSKFVVVLKKGPSVIEQRGCATMVEASEVAENWINQWGEFNV